MVQLDPQGAATFELKGGVQPPVLDPQVVQQSQRLAREVAELGVVPLTLQLGDHDHRQHDLVLGKAQHGARVGQQNGGVEHEGTTV